MRHVVQIVSVVFGLMLIGFLLYADGAHAAGPGAGTFSCSGGTASGQLYNSSGSCPTTLNMSNLFSFLVCNTEQLASNLMGHMYCGMMQSLTPVVWGTVTLAVIFFGASFTIGLTPATGRDALLFMLKLTFVTGFATNADLLIGIGYRLLITSIHEGVSIVLSGLGEDGITSGDDVFKKLDGFLAQIFHYATDSVAVTNTADRCKNAVFAALVTMAVAFPLLAYLGLMLLGRFVLTFFRAVFGYLYALVGITFLMVLAPFFVTFYLFKETRPFFDKWIGYLVSFTLQVVLLFAGLAFILMIPAKHMTDSLPPLIMPTTQTFEATSFRFPIPYCTMCDFKVVDKDNPGTELTAESPDFIKKGKMVCKTHAAGTGVDSQGRKPITLTFAVAPEAPASGGSGGSGGSSGSSGSSATSAKSQLSALLTFAGNGLLALIVLAVLLERLLAQLPYLAQKLASGLGVTYAPQLGGGKGYAGPSMPMPGDALLSDFKAGFDQGWRGDKGSSQDGASSAMRGVRDGFAAMVTGKTASGQAVVGQDENGQRIQAQGIRERISVLGTVRR